MPWCPKCMSEYEENVLKCAECGVELVENLDEAIEYVPLMTISEGESDNILEYLNYLKITYVTNKDENNVTYVEVESSQYEEALKFLKVYSTEKMKEKIDAGEYEEQVSEYVTENLDVQSKIKELKSSAYSFLVVGIGMVLFFGLNVFSVLNVVRSNTYNYFFLITGLAFVIVGVITFGKIPNYREKSDKLKAYKDEISEWYTSKVDLSTFYEIKGINEEDYDEGSLYFMIIDMIKKDIIEQYPDTDKAIINSIAEELYNKIINE